MTFVVSGDKRNDLRRFTEMLFSAFPGITVYEHMNADEAAECVKTHRVNAVFIDGAWDAANEFRLLCSLRRSGSDIPVYVFAEDDRYEEESMWNEATGYLLQPDNSEELRQMIAPLRTFAG